MYSNILVPVAIDRDASFDASLKIALALASDGAEITLLHAMETPPGYVLQYIPADLVKATREGVEAELEKSVRDLPGGKYVVLDGHAGRSICDWAADKSVDLIVMASHRPGIGDVIWGSTAAHVVRHVDCAVHVVR